MQGFVTIDGIHPERGSRPVVGSQLLDTLRYSVMGC